MPYKSGSWGTDAQERSKHRIEYFHTYNRGKYVEKQEEIKEASASYYERHRAEILEKRKRRYADPASGLREKMLADHDKNKDRVNAERRKRYAERQKGDFLNK